MGKDKGTGSRSVLADGREEEEFHRSRGKFTLVVLHQVPEVLFLTGVDGLCIVENEEDLVVGSKEILEWRVA